MKDAAREGNGAADSAAQVEATSYKPKKPRGKRAKGAAEENPPKKNKSDPKATMSKHSADANPSSASKPDGDGEGPNEEAKAEGEEAEANAEGEEGEAKAEGEEGEAKAGGGEGDEEKAKPKRSGRKKLSPEELQSEWKQKEITHNQFSRDYYFN